MTEQQTTAVNDPWGYIPPESRIRYDLELVSIPNAVRVAARRYASADALVDDGVRLSFSDLDARMLDAVRAVLALGVRPGDRVALWAPNCARWVIAALGILGAGAVLVPVNTRFKGAEADDVLRRSGASALFLTADFLDTDYVGMLRPTPDGARLLGSGRVVALSGGAEPGLLSWEQFLSGGLTVAAEDADAAINAVTGSSMSDLMFTSGTTGHPKGVCLDHAQSLRAHGWFAKMMDFRPGDRYLIIPPFFHTFGYKAGWMACIVHGVAIHPAATFDVDAVLDAIATERISILLGPPTVFQAILDSPRRADVDLTSLRVVMASATTVPPDLLYRIHNELRPEVIHGGYGLTEATSLVTSIVPGADDVERIATTVGRPAWGVEVRLVDAAGQDVPTGEAGEVLVRGYNVMSGYWQAPEHTAEVIDSDGWLHTGDLATRDEDGYLRIVDRKKDVVLVGGFTVYPAEVERILGEHPDVESIAVVAMPDERLGEVPVAFVVARPGAVLTEDDFVSWSAPRIANFKLPRRTFVVETLPRNASMKVKRNELRQQVRNLR